MRKRTAEGSILGETSRAQSLRSVAWVAAFLGVSEAWVYRAVRAGRIPHLRLVGAIRFDPEAVRNWARSASDRPATLPRAPVGSEGGI